MPHLTEILALLAVLGVGAQWLGWRYRIPAIVLLILCGLLVGPVLGVLRPSEDMGAAYQPLINLAVAAILFEGGLSLRLAELKQAAAGVYRLVTLTVALTLPMAAAAAHWIGGFSWPVALVFGAISIVTGPTVILPLLRHARLLKRPASYLKWEGIVNDPIGAVLTVAVFGYFAGTDAGELGTTLTHMLIAVGGAAVLGSAAGWLLGRAFRAGHVPEYLKGPMALVAALGVYAIANLLLKEAGLIAATVMGIVIGNMNLPSIGELRRFKEYIAVLLVSGVFLLLTSDLQRETVLELDLRLVGVIVVVIFVVRPAAVWLATIGAGMSWQERALVGWVAPRGVVAAAVAGVLGPQLAGQGFAGGELLLPLVFGLILTTVLLHGLSLRRVAGKLALSAQREGGLIIAGATAWSSGLAAELHDLEVPVIVADNGWHRLRRARLAGVPVYFGELLSEHAENALELGAYDSLLAATNNDPYNALVCAHFAPALGRQQVLQLAVEDFAEPRRPSPVIRGRTAFGDDVCYEDLQRNWYRGWGFYSTPITQEFDMGQFRASLPADAIPLLVIGTRHEVRVIEAGSAPKAEPGERILWFGCREDRGGNGEASATAQARQRSGPLLSRRNDTGLGPGSLSP